MSSDRNHLKKRLARGAIAGALGTFALNVTTYGDMLMRARAASETPANVAAILAAKAGAPWIAPQGDDDGAKARRQAAGALLGYVTGVSAGAAYGLLRRQERRSPFVVAGLGLGLAAMAASDLPIALTGVSNPTTWSLVDWASDVIPHAVYGLVASGYFEYSAHRGPSGPLDRVVEAL